MVHSFRGEQRFIRLQVARAEMSLATSPLLDSNQQRKHYLYKCVFRSIAITYFGIIRSPVSV
ncbi:hypothetical protein L3V77_12100 [Vibrio sp. DW001]|uniref:hypothetical protein n=1 Tax=Vibrio sp. DW001 TaxID=2912315 RepID=UPI0023B1419B|nr:hypothetical protein [Vibrio sp. DW001]WED25789.1 hypothetical protein L3V77_12100 [Vibrio sp. DW001]